MGTKESAEPRGYRLIDADAHINEPPDLWTTACRRSSATGRPASSGSSRATPGWAKE